MMKFKRLKSARAGRRDEIIVEQRGFVPFTGELMRCVLCQLEELSDPECSKGWLCWVLDGRDHFYICAGCQPAAGYENRRAALTDVHVRACEAFKATRADFTPAARAVLW